MPYPSDAQVPLSDAVARAADLGIAAELLSGVEIRPHNLLVALTTSDPDSLVAVRWHDSSLHPVDELLFSREASGVDRWDYPFSVHCVRDRLVLRLTRGGATCDIPVIPAVPAILYTHGWRDDPTLLAPASVYGEELSAALRTLAGEAASGISAWRSSSAEEL